MKSQNKDEPCIIYNNEMLETLERFKYVGVKVPSNHRWSECTTNRLEAKNRAYYVFLKHMQALDKLNRAYYVFLKHMQALDKLSIGSSRNTFSTLW